MVKKYSFDLRWKAIHKTYDDDLSKELIGKHLGIAPSTVGLYRQYSSTRVT